eukprot:16435927-Heterocapsa_arctica.AAC.1
MSARCVRRIKQPKALDDWLTMKASPRRALVVLLGSDGDYNLIHLADAALLSEEVGTKHFSHEV